MTTTLLFNGWILATAGCSLAPLLWPRSERTSRAIGEVGLLLVGVVFVTSHSLLGERPLWVWLVLYAIMSVYAVCVLSRLTQTLRLRARQRRAAVEAQLAG